MVFPVLVGNYYKDDHIYIAKNIQNSYTAYLTTVKNIKGVWIQEVDPGSRTEMRKV